MKHGTVRVCGTALLSLLIAIFVCTTSKATDSAVNHSGNKVPEAHASSRNGELWESHVKRGRVYFRIPAEVLGREFGVWKRLWRFPYGYGGQVAVWERYGDELLLRSVAHSGREGGMSGERKNEGWSARFRIESVDDDESMVVDVSRLFVSSEDTNDWALSESKTSKEKESFPKVESFGSNVVVTYGLDVSDHDRRLNRVPIVQWNFFSLPSQPMRPRYLDRRTGYMHPAFAFAGLEPSRTKREFILRWRVEKAHSGEKVSPPVSPILVQIDPNTPDRWKPWVRRGIESWQRAFEKIGISQAIVADEPLDTGIWSYDDMENTVLCWNSSKQGCGWQIHDPRTGEKLQAQVGGTAGALKHRLAKYVVTMAAVDERVMESPINETLLGQLVQMVAAHETGHLLGLRDGSYGEYAYPISVVRSSEWVRRIGFTPSILNYTRFNYVAQPEDEIPVELLIQQLGPADDFSIAWGYMDFVESSSSEEDWQNQQAMLELAYEDPLYRYNNHPIFNTGPDATVDAVEVTDPIRAAQLGLLNLERSIFLLSEKRLRFSEDEEIRELLSYSNLYDAALEQWFNIIRPVGSLVNGYTVVRIRDLEEGDRFGIGDKKIPVSEKEQGEAVNYLCDIFRSDLPPYLLHSPFVRFAGLSRDEAVERVSSSREKLLRDIVTTQRADQERSWKAKTYSKDLAGLGRDAFDDLINCIGEANISESVRSGLSALEKVRDQLRGE